MVTVGYDDVHVPKPSGGGNIGQLLRTVWGYYFVSFFNTHRR